MKQTLMTALSVATLTTAAILATSSLVPPQARAAAGNAAAAEKYKVLTLTPYGNQVHDLENDLNKLAAEGWQVRTGVGAILVLAR